MRKLFRRREFLHLRTRDAIECFGLAWVARSWLDPTWGGVGTGLWWANMILSAFVVVAMLTIVFTKAKAGPKMPTFDEQLRQYLKARDYRLITNELAARTFPGLGSFPIVESPFVPKGKFFAVNPDTLSEMIRKSDPIQFRFRLDDGPEVCPITWVSDSGPCPRDGAERGLHKCWRNGAHTRKEDACLCTCGASTVIPWAHIAKDQRAEQERLDLLKPPHERPVRDVEGPE